jgi:hypothetical protein
MEVGYIKGGSRRVEVGGCFVSFLFIIAGQYMRLGKG